MDERTKAAKDYRYLGEPEWSAIFAPAGAPEWAQDRQQLWSAVERREDESTRPDQAQLARDFKIALPHELNAEQRRTLVKDFASELARCGMIVDVAIHAPDKNNDERNFHVHMLVTMREIGPGGFGRKVREWNKETALFAWKERWSELGSLHLRRAGFELEAERFRVGHLTLEKQREAALLRGDQDWADTLDRIPKKHMGPHASALENRGVETHIGDLNHEIEQRNKRLARMKDLSRADGEIRLAYQLTDRAQAFADALEDRGLILARVSSQDLPKLSALEKRRLQEREAEFQRKTNYCDTRLAEELGHDNSQKIAELLKQRKKLENDYNAGLPWIMRKGGPSSLTREQRENARASYENWQYKGRFDFETYVTYVQRKWRERPPESCRFKVGELVVVDAHGEVHPLTGRNTGDDSQSIKKYLREVNTAPLFSVTGAWEVLKEVSNHRREEAEWPKRERVWPINPPEPYPIPTSSRNWFEDAARVNTRDFRPFQAPKEINLPRSLWFVEQPAPARIWEAFHRNRHDPGAFVRALDEHGILLCAPTKTEADSSHRNAEFAKEMHRYSPRYREGEVLAMAADARIYRLNESSLGAGAEDVTRLLKKIDPSLLPSIAETTRTMEQRADAREAAVQIIAKFSPLKAKEFDRSIVPTLRSLNRDLRFFASTGARPAERVGRSVGRLLEFGADLFASVLAPVLTPEQRCDGEKAEFERRQRAFEELELRRQSPGRDR